MISLEIIQRIWDLMEPPSPDTEHIEARELDMIDTPSGYPMLTIDAQWRRHLLIPIQRKVKTIKDTQSAGIHLLANQWGTENHKQHYVDIVCLKPHLNHIFDLMVFDILEALPEDISHPDRVCYGVLNHWRELLNREVSVLPDTSILLGIVGELCVLRELAIHNSKIVSAWVGPTGARYDFYTGMTALEVKTSLSTGRKITIHGHDQMEPPTNGELYLAVLKLEETPGNGESLLDIIQTLTNMGCDRLQILLLLSKLDITLDIIHKCNNIRFRILDYRIYRVDSLFPCITSYSFKGDALPPKIAMFNYQIDLSSEPPYPLETSVLEALYQRIACEMME